MWNKSQPKMHMLHLCVFEQMRWCNLCSQCILKAVNSLEIAIQLTRNQCNTFWEFITWFYTQSSKKNKLIWVTVKFKEI